MAEQKSQGVALILSLLIPGLGQIYNGEVTKGVLFILLALVFGFLFILLIGIPLYIILWIYGMVDAYRGAERYNRAHPLMAPAGPAGAWQSSPPAAPSAGPIGQGLGQMVCPECGRRYTPTQGRFCTVDGAELRPAP